MTKQTTSDSRRRIAADALAALGPRRADHQRLSVQCPRSHHVAAVFATTAGLVFHSITGPHSHGSKDRVDTAHKGGQRGKEYVDLLVPDAMGEDAIPAWCECGPWNLSRSDLVKDAEGDRPTVRLA